ncbi:MAG: hypothetical protein R3B70_07170 [Polyangiaceae bacterium]
MPKVPAGSEQVAAWAGRRGLMYQPSPDESWFREWEPFDTMAPPTLYLNACTLSLQSGQTTVVEPWYADEDGTPLERTVFAFVTHPGIRYKASARGGEHFLTRVAFLESRPPPEIKVGDELWDSHVKTFAWTEEEGRRAFHRRIRRLLAGWGFTGHLELRRGGLALHYAGLVPVPRDYDRMLLIVRDLVSTAIHYP